MSEKLETETGKFRGAELRRVARVISVDPGLTNVGLAVLDDQWRVVELKHVALPNGGKLCRFHFESRTEWVAKLAEEVAAWFDRYVLPRLLLNPECDDVTLVVVEENDLALTRDWAGVLAGMLAGWESVKVVTVLPRVVRRWMVGKGMPPLATRPQKKQFAVEFVGRVTPAPHAHLPFVMDDHSADACMNALYVRERFFGQ